ncbi:MAG: hypothetical protein ACK56F_10010, partial [bacterium]
PTRCGRGSSSAPRTSTFTTGRCAYSWTCRRVSTRSMTSSLKTSWTCCCACCPSRRPSSGSSGEVMDHRKTRP